MMIVLLFCFSLSVSASPFTLQNLKQEPLTSPVVGEKFIISCTLTQEYSEELKSTIEKTFSELAISNNSVRKSISLLKGSRTQSCTISWLVQAHKVGTYTIGGCQLGTDALEKFTFQVLLERVQSDKILQPQARLQAKHTFGYSGQAFECALQCTIPTGAKNIQITVPDHLQEYSILDQAIQKTTLDKNFAQITYTLYITLPASQSLTVPALLVSYEVEQARSFGFFVSRQSVTEQIFSNAIEIPIKQTPRPVHAIGKLYSYSCSAHDTADSQQQNRLVEVNIQGDYQALMQLKKPSFKQAAGIRVYEGKNTLERNRLTIEYVIQGLENGMVELQPEDLWYLDVDTQKTLKISSNSIQLTFEGITKIDNEPVYESKSDLPHAELVQEKIEYAPSVLFKYAIGWAYFWGIISLLFGMYLVRRCWDELSQVVILICIPIQFYVRNYSAQECMFWYNRFLQLWYRFPSELTYDALVALGVDSPLVNQYERMQKYAYSGIQISIPAHERRVIARLLYGLLVNALRSRFAPRISLILLCCYMPVSFTATSVAQEIAHLRHVQRHVWTPVYTAIEDEIQKKYKESQASYQKNRIGFYILACVHVIPLVITQIAILILLALLLFYVTSRRVQHVLCAFLCLSFFIVCGYVYERKYVQGLVAQPMIALKNGPGLEFATIGRLPYLEECIILDSYDSWIKVRSYEKIGWIQRADMVIVESFL